MKTLTIAELVKDAEREFIAAFQGDIVVKSCETFGESHYRGGFRLVLASNADHCEVVYSDMELNVSFNSKEIFGHKIHRGFEGNMFSREHLREYLPRIAASAVGEARSTNVQG